MSRFGDLISGKSVTPKPVPARKPAPAPKPTSAPRVATTPAPKPPVVKVEEKELGEG
jgi:hypothetical protein